MLRIAGTLGCSALIRVVQQGVGLSAPQIAIISAPVTSWADIA